MVAVRREGQTRDANPPQSSRLADHEHRFLIRRTQSGLRRIIIDLHRAKQQGLGGGSIPQSDLRGIAGPECLTASPPSTATNKEKAAVLVTSLPPVLCWLCPEAQEVLMLTTLGGAFMTGWGRSPLDL